jgi:SnoaL-like domain
VPSSDSLRERQEIEDVVVRLFVATDRHDWASVEACLADMVILDMASLAGGEPLHLKPIDVIAAWKRGLEPIDQVHHQVGNFQIDVDGNRATAFCYGVAYHHRENISSPSKSRTFVGSYDVHLTRSDAKWRIDLFRFNLKFIEGNRELEMAT